MKTLFAAAILTAVAGSALADSVTLKTPLAGGVLHEGGVDLALYWTEAGTGAELTGTWTAHDGAYAPARFRMLLEEGDAVSFGLPGEPQLLYSFARRDGVVTAHARKAPVELAAK